MCQQTPTWASIITDTLVTDVTGGKNVPTLYLTKVWTYLHANMLMVVTGLSDLGDAVDDFIRRKIGIRDIEDLNKVATPYFQELFANLQKWYEDNLPGEESGTATIYMFGFPHESSEMVRYTYRSTTGFESERTVETESMFFAKPGPRNFDWSVPTTREEAVALAIRIRDENGDGTAEGTVAIGGEIQVTVIERYRITSELLYRFPDYEDTWQKMLKL